MNTSGKCPAIVRSLDDRMMEKYGPILPVENRSQESTLNGPLGFEWLEIDTNQPQYIGATSFKPWFTVGSHSLLIFMKGTPKTGVQWQGGKRSTAKV